MVILEDVDTAGAKKAAEAAEAIYHSAASVRSIKLPGLDGSPGRTDVSEWLDTDAANCARLTNICIDAPLWTPPIVTKLSDWLRRDIKEPDLLMGHVLNTTGRALLWAATGLGKTLFCMSIGFTIAEGVSFLGWRGCHRNARVLYIDGEMSAGLFKERMRAEVKRSGLCPDDFHALSHEDFAGGLKPLNTPEGQAQIEVYIRRIKPDIIIFDNIMCLIIGDMKEEEGWSKVLMWLHSLTRRRIGQLWIHHTGHDQSKGYGSKTREWQMDTVMGLSTVERDDTDVSFRLTFTKARLRTPATREEFAEQHIALVNDKWEWKAAGKPSGQVAPITLKFYEALCSSVKDEKMHEHPAASLKDWQAECIKCGLLERVKDKGLPNTERARFSNAKRELIGANRIATNDTVAWLV